MSAMPQDITAIKISIQDCRANNAWPVLKPLIWRLYHASVQYCDARRYLLDHIEDPQNESKTIYGQKFQQAINTAELVLAKLRKKSAHFPRFPSLDIFCPAMVQAIMQEFDGDTQNIEAS